MARAVTRDGKRKRIGVNAGENRNNSIEIATTNGWRKRVAIVLAITIAIVAIRGSALFTPYSDPTVGLYLLIGNALLNGHLPYTIAWDYRPPGFFALYAAGIAAFGPALARDALAVVSLVATTLAVGDIAQKLMPRSAKRTGAFAMLFFVLLSPANDALAGAAELQINAFIAWSIAFSQRSERGARSAYLISGFLAGCALECKLSAVALIILPFILEVFATKSIVRAALFLLAAALPTIAITTIYAAFHELHILYDANVAATIRRSQARDSASEFARNRVWLVRQLWSLAPEVQIAAVVIFLRDRHAQLVCGLWILLSLLSIAIVGEWYERQFVLLTPPISIAAAIALSYIVQRLGSRQLVRRSVVATVALASFLILDYHDIAVAAGYALHRGILHETTWHQDQAEQVYECLRARAGPRTSVFLIEQNPFLYDRLHVALPTRFPYSDHLLDPRLSGSAGIDGDAELRRIFAKQPDFVVTSTLRDYRYDAARIRRIHTALENYRPVCVGPNFILYRNRLRSQLRKGR